MNEYYKKMNLVISDYSMKQNEINDNVCEHNYIVEYDGHYEVCNKCGECNDKTFFIVQNENGIGYKEEINKFKIVRYSKLNDIKKKLIDFNISQQYKEENKTEYKKVLSYIKNNLPMKIIKQAIKNTNSSLSYEEFFYNLKKPIKYEFTNNQINNIIRICDKFIKTYKEIKNINKKVLVYVVVEDTYKYNLANWICSMNEDIINKYRVKLQELNCAVKAETAKSHVL